jgi:chromosome segregation ATPase
VEDKNKQIEYCGTNQSRESASQILEIKKDIEHLDYVLKELEKDKEFLKDHFTLKNTQRQEDIAKIHDRLDKHIQTELEYHQGIRDKATTEHASIHKRIGQAERWIWIFFGGITAISALMGKGIFSNLFGG